MGQLRRCPGTLGYLAVLLATHLVVFHLLPEDARQRALRDISTNLAAMGWSAPFRLVASALVVVPSGGLLNVALIVVVGVGMCLGWLEYRLGTWRALGIFAAAHVLVSMVVLVIAAAAVRTGRYPEEVTHQIDYGVSFGALGAVGAVTPFLPRRLRPVWAAVALVYPLTAADWYGWLPDYTTLGHVLSVATGLSITTLLLRTGRAAAAEPGSGTL